MFLKRVHIFIIGLSGKSYNGEDMRSLELEMLIALLA
jgi:hypothetical protein